MTIPTNVSGWVCDSCGAWVPSGTGHLCNWTIPAAGFATTLPVDHSYAILTELREIKELLKGLK